MSGESVLQPLLQCQTRMEHGALHCRVTPLWGREGHKPTIIARQSHFYLPPVALDINDIKIEEGDALLSEPRR